ncbi:MAG: 2-hydroxyacyl-CoA dehydratase, partial [Spirochaetota bacterium]|nr:2-hydroxyacyl-CoA dehydratase [Spirochaetota bacterium]
MKKKIGITSTIPIEIIYAADMIPVDLNNIFITHEDPGRFLMTARKDGFPETCCSWISGIYGIVKESGIETVVGVVGGDCSETIALMEVLSMKGIEVLSFAYPHSKLKHLIKEELLRFAQSLDVNIRYAEEEKIKLDSIRQRIHHLDDLLWRENKAYGEEVHLFQLASSDFDGDPKKFKERINNKITEIEKRKPIDTDLRLGYVGVPPIISDLYSFIEKDNVRIVYNEVQRQFSLPVL